MSSKVFHGDPGSYKTSTAICYGILPALRSGRVVITNIEGFYDLETIETALDETFPETAQLWRFSTLNSEGLEFVQRWFQWAPVGALLVIDEVQNVYSEKDRTDLKTLDYPDSSHTTKQVIESFSLLPAELSLTTLSLLDSFEDDGYRDDSGKSELDDNGHIIYPKNIKDAMMRHRKFNWDLIFCTPDIEQVHKLIRQTSELALRHVSYDFIPIPWFQRRPRCNEHNAKLSGLSNSKNQTVLRRKIPLETFKLYKSTQTGRSNKSGQSSNPLKSVSLIFSAFAGLSLMAYFFLYFLNKFGDSEVADVVEPAVVVSKSVVRVPQNGLETVGSVASPVVGDDSNKAGVPSFLPDVLEIYGVTDLYISGVVTSIINHRISYDYFFTYFKDDKQFSLSGDDLQMMGYQVGFNSVCSVVLLFQDVKRFVFCPPNEVFFGDSGGDSVDIASIN